MKMKGSRTLVSCAALFVAESESFAISGASAPPCIEFHAL